MNNPQRVEDPLIILIDDSSIARREVVIRDAIEELKQTETQGIWNSLSVQKLSLAQKFQARELSSRTNTITLVVITEWQLSSLAQGVNIARIPCESIRVGHELIDQIGTGNDIYFVVHRGGCTALDVLAMLLSGARGVIDAETLGSVKTLKHILDATQEDDKKLNRLVIGGPYYLLSAFTEIESTWQLEASHWSLLFALAEVPRNRLSIDQGYKATNAYLARELDKWNTITGYVTNSATQRYFDLIREMIEGELRKLSVTDTERVRAWTRESVEDQPDMNTDIFEWQNLPLYARQLGLPSTLLPVRGVDDTNLSSWLHKGLQRVRFKKPVTKAYPAIGHVTIPRNLHDPARK